HLFPALWGEGVDSGFGDGLPFGASLGTDDCPIGSPAHKALIGRSARCARDLLPPRLGLVSHGQSPTWDCPLRVARALRAFSSACTACAHAFRAEVGMESGRVM